MSTNITERIKTFDDALAALPAEHPMVRNWTAMRGLEDKFSPNLAAYAKLCIIVAALNEDWELHWGSDQAYYYPWFYIYSKAEVETMMQDRKDKLVLFGGDASRGSLCGRGYVSSSNAWSYANARIGSRLAFRSKELAIYCAEQFLDIWAQYLS
ncbi:MAG: hypothetical protein IKO33_02295 [Bacteroidaceae bacterium]|nr:hypothetical protein [Bacteroidaceae bacterium]